MLRHLAFLCLLTGFSHAQEEIPKARKFPYAFGIRGKVLGGPVIEDVILFNTTIGAEFRFFRDHSIGIDYVFFRKWYENDIYDTVKHEEGVIGPDLHTRTNFLHVDYRYYPHAKIFEEKNVFPYVNVFGKIGTRRVWTDNGYYSNYEIIDNQTNYRQFGASLGVQFGNIVGADVNIGIARSFDKRSELNHFFETGLDQSIHEELTHYEPVMRVNVFWYLFRRDT